MIAPNPGADDRFGHTVALAGNRLIVGAPLEDSGATGIDGNLSDNSLADSAAIYVFELRAAEWVFSTYLKASEPSEGDTFGGSIAASDQFIAATTEHSRGSFRGVQPYERVGAQWTVGKLLAPRQTIGALAMDAGTLAAADHSDQSGRNPRNERGPGSGTAFLFKRNTDGTWSDATRIKASNPENGDRFGHSIALDGETLAVGARNEDSGSTGINGDQDDNSAEDGGAVYVRRLGVW
ncbi:MAG: hypothetical protein ACFB9M_02680 [Myxococcota bacterium]